MKPISACCARVGVLVLRESEGVKATRLAAAGRGYGRTQDRGAAANWAARWLVPYASERKLGE